ncbi:MAG: hypothetical protein HY762_08140, partial [Planctomycetes bacterium]|nr:hypothetical protein [Planctomycetota bacterium]
MGKLLLFLVVIVFCGFVSAGISETGQSITNVKVIHRWIPPEAEGQPGQHVFDISGVATFPDETVLNLALTYQGERCLVSRTVVKNSKFATTIKVNSNMHLLPAYYEIEIIFLPNRQPAGADSAGALSKIPAKSVSVTARVGHTESINKERQQTIDLFQSIREETKSFYEDLRSDYKKYHSQKVDPKSWDDKFSPDLKHLKQAQQNLNQRKNIYLISIFPEIESQMISFLGIVETLYDELANEIKSGKPTTNLHSGKKMRAEDTIKR